MKIVAEFNSIQEIKDFAELIGQKELVLKADYIKPEKEEPKALEAIEPNKVDEVQKIDPVVEEVAPAEEVKKISKDDVRGIFSKLVQAGKQKEAKELTNKYGAKKIPEIKEEDYEAIYKEAEGLL